MNHVVSNQYSFLLSIYAFVLSIVFSGYYVGGDQYHYTDFYDNVASFDILEAYRYYNSKLGASEVVYFLIVYLFSPYISKLILFSIINSILAFYLTRALLRLGMAPLLLFPIGLNFYLLVLFFAAERLKLSMTFLIIALSVANGRSSIIFTLLSVLSHFQAAFLIQTRFTKLFISLGQAIIRQSFSKVLGRASLVIISIVVFFVIFKDPIISKTTGYSDSFMSINNIIKPGLFCLLSILYTRNHKLTALVMQLPIVVGAYFLGDIRMTIFSFFIFIYFGVQYNRGLNIGVIGSLLYFASQGWDFLQNVLLYGEGFNTSVSF